MRFANQLNYFLIICITSWLTACGGGTGDTGNTSGAQTAAVSVFLADKETDEKTELYISNNDGSEPRKLSGALINGANVNRFIVSPDKKHVAYIADQDSLDVIELYIVEIASGNISKVSGTMALGVDIFGIYWAPDSSRIAYTTFHESDRTLELYTAIPDGSNTVKITVTSPHIGQSINKVAWAPDSSRLAYVADQSSANVDELYTAFPDGSASTKVSGPLVSGGDVGANITGPILFRWSPDSTRIAYIADQDTDGLKELYRSFATGPNGNTKISGTLAVDEEASFIYEWSPDSSFIAYLVEAVAIFDNKSVLFLSTSDGNINNVISNSSESGNVISDSSERGVVSIIKWSPIGNLLAFLADRIVEGVSDDIKQLYVTDTDGLVRKVSGDLVSGGEVKFNYEWAPDGSRIAYIADQDTDDVRELYTNTPDGANNIKISGPMVTNGGVGDRDDDRFDLFFWSPDSKHIAYRADEETDGVIELFLSRADIPGSNKISAADTSFFTRSSNGSSVAWAADSDLIVYRARPNNRNQELYSVSIDGSDNIKISGSLITSGNVMRYTVVD
jgi:hypothetical protein